MVYTVASEHVLSQQENWVAAYLLCVCVSCVDHCMSVGSDVQVVVRNTVACASPSEC